MSVLQSGARSEKAVYVCCQYSYLAKCSHDDFEVDDAPILGQSSLKQNIIVVAAKGFFYCNIVKKVK